MQGENQNLICPSLWQIVNNKGRDKENLHPLLYTGETTMTRDKEKTEVLDAAFASVFNSKISCFLYMQPPVTEDEIAEQSQAPLIQEAMMRDTPCHLDMGPDGICWGLQGAQGAEGVGRGDLQVRFHHLSTVLADWGSSIWLEAGECKTHF